MNDALAASIFFTAIIVAMFLLARRIAANFARDESAWDDGYTIRQEPQDEMGDI